MIHRIMGWFQGSLCVVLQASARQTRAQNERFLNLCKAKGINLWGIEWNHQTGALFFRILRQDYAKLIPVVEKTRLLPRILQKRGGYFLFLACKKRGSFWIGVGLFLSILFLLGSRIWTIKVEGASIHSQESVMAYLNEMNIYGGVASHKLVCQKLENRIRKDFGDVGWVSVEKTGSSLYVRIQEVIAPEPKEKQPPSSIIASQDGRVFSVVTKNGRGKVRAGQKVTKGKVLISGVIPVKGDGDEIIFRERVCAQGNVVLQCPFTYRDVLPVQEKKWVATGRKKNLYQMQLFGKNLFLYNPLKNLETYKKYDIIREGGSLCPFISLRFPLKIWKKTRMEKQYQKVTYSPQEAEFILKKRYRYYVKCHRQTDGWQRVTGSFSVNREENQYVATTTGSFCQKQIVRQAVKAAKENKTKKDE